MRRDAEAAFKRLRKASLAREAHGGRYGGQGVVGLREQLAGALHAALAHPPHGRCALDVLEQAGELARAHARCLAHVLQRNGLAQMLARVGAGEV